MTARDVAEKLNRALAADPVAISALFDSHVMCNVLLEDVLGLRLPTHAGEGYVCVGLLSIVNSLIDGKEAVIIIGTPDPLKIERFLPVDDSGDLKF